MAERTHRELETSKHKAVVLFAKLTGAGAADLTVSDTGGQLPSEIVSATRTGVGTFTIAFRYKYNRLLAAPTFSFVGTNPGMQGKCTAIDVSAGTATFLISYSTTPTDPASTDTIYITWTASNSGLAQ
jgi:hypothetical protein